MEKVFKAIPGSLLLEQCSMDFKVNGIYEHHVKSVFIPRGTMVEIFGETPNDIDIRFDVEGIGTIETSVIHFEYWDLEDEPEGKPHMTIDLDGPEGNIFFIGAKAIKVMREFGIGEEVIKFMTDSILKSKSYDEARALIGQHVDVEYIDKDKLAMSEHDVNCGIGRDDWDD